MAPAPVNSPYSPAPQPQPQLPTVTPFDSQIKASPVPLTALAGAALLGFLLMTQLPWLQINVPFLGGGSLNYFQCWQLLQQLSRNGSGEGAELVQMLTMPLLAFVSILGSLIVSLNRKTQHVAAGLMLTGGILGVLTVGGLFLFLKSKTVDAMFLRVDPSALLGPGFWGFGLLSAAAAGVGLWVLVASQSRK